MTRRNLFALFAGLLGAGTALSRRHNPPVRFDPRSIQLTPADCEFLEARQFAMNEIASVPWMRGVDLVELERNLSLHYRPQIPISEWVKS